jgi:hypothetical protein
VGHVTAAVYSAHKEPQPVDGSVERVRSEYDASSCSDAVNGGYDGVIDLSSETVPSRVEETTSRRYSTDGRLNKCTHRSRSHERDLNINTGNNSDSGVKNVSRNRHGIQKNAKMGWRPVYEDISEADSDTDSITDTGLTEMGKSGLVSTQHLISDCDRPRNSAGQRRNSDSTDVTGHMAEPLNERRYSAPEDSGSSARKEEKQKEKYRRWSFNTETDMYQTDRGETTKKLYLNRLLFSKNSRIKSWDICIDIARDEHTAEEFQFPDLPLPRNSVVKVEEGDKEDIEAAAVDEGKSPDVVDVAREPSPVNEEAECWDFPGSDIKQEINIEDEDTIDGPRTFMTAPKDEVNETYNCTEVTEGPSATVAECSLNKWMISFASGVPSDNGEEYGVALDAPESQVDNGEGSVHTPESQVDNGEGSVHTPEELEPDDSSSGDACIVPSVGKDKLTGDVPYNVAEIVKEHDCSTYAHHQNTNLAYKQIQNFRGFLANPENDTWSNIGSGGRRHRSSPECPEDKDPEDSPRNNKKSSRSTDSVLPIIEEGGAACNTCSQHGKSVTLHDLDSDGFSEELGCRESQTCQETFSRKQEIHPSTALLRISSQEYITEEERISRRRFTNTSDSRSHKEPQNYREVEGNENDDKDRDKEVSICKKSVYGIADQTERTHGVCTEGESERAAEVVNEGRESREPTSGNSCSSLAKIATKRKNRARLQRGSKKGTPGNNSRTRKKPLGPRKPRYSRRSFRHDSIQMFKVSTAFPPHTTPVPWRYKCKKPELLDPLNTDSGKSPSPVTNSIVTDTRFDGCVTNIEIEDDIPSPASLTIDLGEQNTNGSESSNLEEDGRSRRNSDASGADGDAVSGADPGRRTSSETRSSAMNGKVSIAASPENQTGGLDSESSEEGQRKKKRRRAKKNKSGMTFQSLCLLCGCMNIAPAVCMHYCRVGNVSHCIETAYISVS